MKNRPSKNKFAANSADPPVAANNEDRCRSEALSPTIPRKISIEIKIDIRNAAGARSVLRVRLVGVTDTRCISSCNKRVTFKQ